MEALSVAGLVGLDGSVDRDQFYPAIWTANDQLSPGPLHFTPGMAFDLAVSLTGFYGEGPGRRTGQYAGTVILPGGDKHFHPPGAVDAGNLVC